MFDMFEYVILSIPTTNMTMRRERSQERTVGRLTRHVEPCHWVVCGQKNREIHPLL